MPSLFNRKQLCLLAGWELEAFKQVQRLETKGELGVLPIMAESQEVDAASDKGAKSYFRYTPLDILALACASQISSGGGLVSKGMTLGDGSKVIGGHLGYLAEVVRFGRENAKNVFVGYATLTYGTCTGGYHLIGTIEQIAKSVADQSADAIVSNIYLTSLPSAISAIEERAALHGIDWKTADLWGGE